MKLLPLDFETVLAVAQDMRRADRQEIFATRWDDNPATLAQDCVGAGCIGAVIAGRDGAPICAIGATEMWPRVWSVWMFATDRWHEVALDATRFVKERLIPTLLDLGLRRAECRSSAMHTQAHRWLEYLGARRETEHLDYGKNGESFIGFYWRAEDVRKSLQETKDQFPQSRKSAATDRQEGRCSGGEGASATAPDDGTGLDHSDRGQ